jgi:nitrate/nitrite transport system substrate-binding protein
LKKIFFASDFHLGIPDEATSREREIRIVDWLNYIQPNCAELFLVGDLFDFWFEYKKVVPKGYVRILGKLAELTDSGIPVHFFVGNHDMWMRYWLAANGIDPTKDVSVVPVPPPQMVANMKVGNMEAFCVGEPWNAQLVNQKAGFTALVTGEFWEDHPEKAFTMRKDWVDANPKAAQAILMAILEAQQWCDKPENIQEMCEIISQDKWFKVPVADIIGRSSGTIDFGTGRVVKNFPFSMKFWKDNASYPYKSHDLWFLTENIRWGYLPPDTDTKKIIDEVNREDLWKEAARALNVPAAEIPASSSRGVETFFDGVKFDPANPEAYLKGLKIKKV